MKVIAGLGYDSRKPNKLQAQLNTSILGEIGLINELEFRAGVIHTIQAKPQRIVNHMEAIRRADTPHRFYHQSFNTDPLACAETLLNWRDWLIDHGWQPQSTSTNHGRLEDLAAIELFTHSLSPCIGERITALLPHTELIKAAINIIEIHTPRSHWSKPFQHLFNKLESIGIKITEIQHTLSIKANPESDLGKLQQAIIDPKCLPLTLNNDGSILLYQSDNVQTAANYTVQNISDQHLIIASDQRYGLNSAAIHCGFSEPGLGDNSNWRAPNQLLPLMIQCMWTPPSAQVIQQYLTLPTGKHKPLRRALAYRFADLPGIDPEIWQQEISDYVANVIADKPELDEEKLRKSIDMWLPIGDANSNTLMPVHLAIELCGMISQYWLAVSANSATKDKTVIFSMAQQSANALENALRNWPDKVINKEQLNRLLDLANDSGNGIYSHSRQISKLNVIDAPEMMKLYDDHIDELLWWDCRLANQQSIPPLSTSELQCVPFAPSENELATQDEARLMRGLSALLEVKYRATLITLNQNPDLLKLTISQLIGCDQWQSLDAAILDNKLIGIPCNKIQPLAFPTYERWWNINSAIPSPRAFESYSSLESLALKPYAYTLKYGAKLTEGTLVSLPFDARLKGNLAHKIVELWLNSHPWVGTAPKASDISNWLDNEFDNIIFQIALPLAASGMRSERMLFKTTIQHAMNELFQHLECSSVKTIKVEHKLKTQLSKTSLEGTIDLLCQLTDNRWVIVDLKWGGAKRYQHALKQGLHLQLATYSHLVENSYPEQVAEVAYFILSTATLMATSPIIFNKALVIEPDEPHRLPHQIWSEFKTTYEWRLSQLQQGKVEITYNQLQLNNDSKPPVNSLPLLEMEREEIAKSSPRYNQQNTFKVINPWRVLIGEIKE